MVYVIQVCGQLADIYKKRLPEDDVNTSKHVGIFKDTDIVANTGLFISLSGISKIDCATTKTDTAERSISMDREFLQVFVQPYAARLRELLTCGGS